MMELGTRLKISKANDKALKKYVVEMQAEVKMRKEIMWLCTCHKLM
jgi:hypothetical protein